MRRCSPLVTCLVALLMSNQSLATPSSPSVPNPEFDFTSEPAQPDWRYFIRAPEVEREKLWQYQLHRGKHLRHWSWGWRLGWVRACSRSDRSYCQGVMREALFDRALVVRAEAATRLGRLYDGSQRDDIIDLLVSAYKDTRNRRRGKPMFVQTRILYALHQIGGPKAKALGSQLASEHELVRRYWQKLEHINGN